MRHGKCPGCVEALQELPLGSTESFCLLGVLGTPKSQKGEFAHGQQAAETGGFSGLTLPGVASTKELVADCPACFSPGPGAPPQDFPAAGLGLAVDAII